MNPKTKNKFLLIVFAITLCTLHSFAQHPRLMFMKNKNRIVYYEWGNTLSFTVKGSKEKITDVIKSFQGDSVIVFNSHEIAVNDIAGVYLDKRNKVFYFMKYKYAKLLLFIGTGYLLLDVINSGEWDKKTLLISGSMITAGIVAQLLISKRIKIKGKKKLHILNL